MAQPTHLHPRYLITSAAGLFAVVVVAVLIGAVDLGPGRVFSELWAQLAGGMSPLSATESSILWELRMPRVVLGILVGAVLATCGAAFQGVFRNPLADPYLLGAAAGAGLGATHMIVLVASDALPVDPIPAGAFLGALLGVGLAWMVSQSAGSGPGVLVLAGAAVTAFLSAVQLALQTANPDRLRAIYSFILGSLGTPGWATVAETAVWRAVPSRPWPCGSSPASTPAGPSHPADHPHDCPDRVSRPPRRRRVRPRPSSPSPRLRGSPCARHIQS